MAFVTRLPKDFSGMTAFAGGRGVEEDIQAGLVSVESVGKGAPQQ